MCFYTDEDYQGESFCARPGEAHDVWRNHYTLNDRFSSVQVPHDLYVKAYNDDGFHGWSKMFSEHASDLGDFSDRIICSFVVGFKGVACFYTEKIGEEVNFVLLMEMK